MNNFKLPPLPYNARRNYHFVCNNNMPYNHINKSRAFSASMLNKMKQQSKIEKNYINNVLMTDLSKLSKEKEKISNEYKNQMKKYDDNEKEKLKRRTILKELNNQILSIQIKEKRFISQEHNREKRMCLDEVNGRLEQYSKLLSIERENNKRIQNYYKSALHSQIIDSLQSKLARNDEISNRSRIKNKLLLNDYINSYNNNQI